MHCCGRAATGSEPAFRQLVECHVNLVYSAARRAWRCAPGPGSAQRSSCSSLARRAAPEPGGARGCSTGGLPCRFEVLRRETATSSGCSKLPPHPRHWRGLVVQSLRLNTHSKPTRSSSRDLAQRHARVQADDLRRCSGRVFHGAILRACWWLSAPFRLRYAPPTSADSPPACQPRVRIGVLT